MSNFYDFLQNIRKRPAMYLGQRSITRLHIFLCGYRFARSELGISQTEQEREFGEFQSWLEQKFNVETTQSWANIILSRTKNESQALDNFFELLDEFLRCRKQPVWDTPITDTVKLQQKHVKFAP
jgi:hypothetical protein